MAERFHLDSVKNRDSTTWYTLVVEDPVNYFVEEYNDTKNAFIKDRTKRIARADLGKHQINGTPLITVVENKMSDIAEAAQIKSLQAGRPKPRQQA